MNKIDYDSISIPEEPIFLRQGQDLDTDSYSTMASSSFSLFDSISMAETRSFVSPGGTLKSITGMCCLAHITTPIYELK